MEHIMFGRIKRHFQRRLDTILFLFRSPSSVKVEVTNARAISVGRHVRLGYFSRVNANGKSSGIRLDDNVWSGRNVSLEVWSGQHIRIGRKSTLQDQCKILGDVEIGAYCTLAPNVYLSSGGHQFKAEPTSLIKIQDKTHPLVSKKITIGEDVWLGINVAVLPGVTIGRGAIIGANATVTTDVEPYSIYGGIPAKKIGSRAVFSPDNLILSSKSDDKIYFYKGFDHELMSENGMRILDNFCEIAVSSRMGASLLKIDCFHGHDRPGQITVQCGFETFSTTVAGGHNELTFNIKPEESHSSQIQFIKVTVEDFARGLISVKSVSIS